MQKILIGTRASLLARTQTEWVAQQLRSMHPGLITELVPIHTTGDERRSTPLAQVGAKGMFVKEIEEALLQGRIDMGVHSMKDMPAQMPPGLEIACVPVREDPRDALLTLKKLTLQQLPQGARMGTSSPRRKALLSALRPDLCWNDLRGNLDTRLQRLQEGRFDAILLASAGLNRLKLGLEFACAIEPEVCLPAPAQGALALEICSANQQVRAILMPLHHMETAWETDAERAFLAALGAGCTVPAAALARCTGTELRLQCAAASPDGNRILKIELSASAHQAAALGKQAAERLLEQGAAALLEG